MLSTDDAPACANGSDEMTKDVGGQCAMAATNSMVCGRRQVARGRGGGNGNNAEMGTMWVR